MSLVSGQLWLFSIKSQRCFIIDDEIRDLVDNKNKYLTHSVNGREDLASLNLWIVCDPDTDKGRRLLSESVDFHVSVAVPICCLF
jgi:hypothetical protein